MASTTHMDLLAHGGMTPRMNGETGGGGNTPKTARAKSGKNVNLSSQQLKVAHQRVNIDVDLSQKKIDGFTELTVIPTSNTLKTVKLDCRETTIKDVYINNIRHANYIYKDNLYINDDSVFEECIDYNTVNVFDLYSRDLSIHQHHLIRQKFNHIFGELNLDPRDPIDRRSNGNTEELVIILPDNLKFELTDLTAIHTPGTDAAATLTPLHLKSKNTSNEAYSPIQILIEYECVNPNNGINFVTDRRTDKKSWHAYTVNSEYNISTSSWIPCIDNLWERCTWSIEINLPRTVKDIGKSRVIGSKEEIKSRKKRKSTANENMEGDDDDDEEDEDNEDYELTVCTGDFNNVKETPHTIDLSKKVVSWSIFNPVCAHHVGWAIGCFQTIALSTPVTDKPEEQTGFDSEMELDFYDDIEKDNANSPVTIYCLPGQLEWAENTCIFANRAMEYFSKEFGSFPFSSYAIAFVNGCVADTNNFAGLTIINDNLLYPPDLIEPMFSVTETILESIATQWSGINIVPQTFNDIWCTLGIAKYMSFQFIRELMGNNEYRFKIKQKMNRIAEEDINKKPLALQFYRFPISDLDLDFLRLKAPLVLFILDRRMTKTDKSFGLSRVLPKLFLQAMSGDLTNGTLSTQHFQYVCEKVNRNKLDVFFRQWVFGAGVPIFNITQSFNKKRSMIEMSIRQVQQSETKKLHPRPDTFIDDAISYLDDEPSFPIQPVFLGPMTIRVHEADGTPYEHIVDLKEGVVRLDIQYNSKFRRLKKNKEETNEPNSNFNKLGDVLMSPREVEEWNLSDWSRHEDDILYNDPFEWIRVDTDFEWIAKINVKQPDYMFGSQLQFDRDVEAQYDAVSYFGDIEKPNAIYCSVLTRTIMDERYYYGIRAAAAQALATFSRPESKFIGVEYLLRIYQHLFCFPHSFVPASNDFADFNNFFLRKEIPKILSNVRDDDGNVPENIRILLLNLVKYNDNSSNDFQDCFYVSDLIKALANSALSTSGSLHFDNSMSFINKNRTQNKDSFLESVVSEINRLQKLDEWVPSYQNVIAVSCLQQKINLATHGKLQLTFEDLLYYTLDKYPTEIRIAAFNGLFVLGGLKNGDILKYFLRVCLLNSCNPQFKSELVGTFIHAVCVAGIDGTPSTLDDPEFKTLEKLMEAGLKMSTNQTNMVIVEDSSNAELDSRRDAFARETLNGAIELLRRDYSIGKGLKDTFWELVHTSLLSIYERRNIFSICQVLYKEVDSFLVRIPVPSVSLNELKKKIVLKNLGKGKVVIKREGRFKIQLTSFKSALSGGKAKDTDKPKEVAEVKEQPPLVTTPSEPKLKLKLSSSTSDLKDKKAVKKPESKKDNKKQDAEKQATPKQEPERIAKPKSAVRDSSNKYKLTFRFEKHTLTPLREIPSTPAIKEEPNVVSTSGSKVTMVFKSKDNQSILRDLMVPKKDVPRYVKILLREKRVVVSPHPFPIEETIPQNKDIPIEETVPQKKDKSVERERESPIEREREGPIEREREDKKDEEGVMKKGDIPTKTSRLPNKESGHKEKETPHISQAGAGKPSPAPQPSEIKKVKITANDSLKDQTKDDIPRIKLANKPPSGYITKSSSSSVTPKPISRSSSVEPEAKPFERAASPFSKAGSPFSTSSSLPKKKKKIYIHSGDKSRSSTPPEDSRSDTADASKRPKESAKAESSKDGVAPVKLNANDNGTPVKPNGSDDNSTANGVKDGNDKGDTSESKPKPAFKLKLKLK